MICSKCRQTHERKNQRLCIPCHAAYMREWRKTHPLAGDARRRMVARAYAHVYRDRGKLVKEPCRACGDPKSEMHHEDYSKPTEVIWLCRPCHLEHHRNEKPSYGSILRNIKR